MAVRFIASLFVLTAVGLLLAGAQVPDPKAIHEQIKSVKAEEKVALKTVHAWYTGFMKRDRLTEEVIELERAALRAQETALVSQAVNAADRKKIQGHFESLRAYLKVGVRLGEVEIAQLRIMRDTHETQLKSVYQSKIAYLENLEAQAKAALKNNKGPKK